MSNSTSNQPNSTPEERLLINSVIQLASKWRAKLEIKPEALRDVVDTSQKIFVSFQDNDADIT